MFLSTAINTLGGARSSYSAQVLADQPSKYLKLNENANPITDFSVNNVGGNFESTTFVFGSQRELHKETGKGLLFMYDATSPHERIEFSHRLSTSPQFTIEFWFTKYFPSNNASVLGSSLVSPTYNWAVPLTLLDSGTRNLCINCNGTRFTSFSWNLGWIYHVVITFAGNQSSVYRNGVLQNTFTDNAIATLIENITLNRASNFWYLGHGSSVTHNMNGLISNFATYNYVLAQEQIARHFTLGYSWQPNDTSLLAWYKEDVNVIFRSGLTQQWSDMSQSATNHLFSLSSTNDMLSNYDSTSFYLAGSNNKYLVSNNAILPQTGNFYIALVVTVTHPLTANNYIFTQSYRGSNSGIGRIQVFVFNVSGNYQIAMFVGASSLNAGLGNIFLQSPVYTASSNYVVVVRRNGNSFTLLVNGVDVANVTDTETRGIQQTNVILGAIDSSFGVRYGLVEFPMSSCRLRELVIGTDINAIPSITTYLGREYQISVS